MEVGARFVKIACQKRRTIITHWLNSEVFGGLDLRCATLRARLHGNASTDTNGKPDTLLYSREMDAHIVMETYRRSRLTTMLWRKHEVFVGWDMRFAAVT